MAIIHPRKLRIKMRIFLPATMIALLGHPSLGLACDFAELRPDPSGPFGCAGFLQCANGQEFSLPCPDNMYFDAAQQTCDEGISPTDCKNASSDDGEKTTPNPFECSDRCAAKEKVCLRIWLRLLLVDLTCIEILIKLIE